MLCFHNFLRLIFLLPRKVTTLIRYMLLLNIIFLFCQHKVQSQHHSPISGANICQHKVQSQHHSPISDANICQHKVQSQHHSPILDANICDYQRKSNLAEFAKLRLIDGYYF